MTAMVTHDLARALYTAYCKAVGGKSFDGKKLPKWDEFSADESKQTQVKGWLAAADAAKEEMFEEMRVRAQGIRGRR